MDEKGQRNGLKSMVVWEEVDAGRYRQEMACFREHKPRVSGCFSDSRGPLGWAASGD